MSFYVYELFDPRTAIVFYVGKGTRSRIDAHEVEARNGRISRKCDMIRLIESAGHNIGKRTVRSFGDEQAAYDFESDLIDKYGLNNLTNIVPGGGTARLGPTIYADRVQVRATAELINRTRNGEIPQILVDNRPFYLLPILEEYKQRAIKIMTVRGQDWVNAISKRFGVEFSQA
jgi:hypothetical protein